MQACWHHVFNSSFLYLLLSPLHITLRAALVQSSFLQLYLCLAPFVQHCVATLMRPTDDQHPASLVILCNAGIDAVQECQVTHQPMSCLYMLMTCHC
jgi:hypothetical protein